MSGQHLVLVVPGWKLSPLHAASRERLMMMCLEKGTDLSIMPEFSNGIDLARNITVAKFLQHPDPKPTDVLGMIDSDIAFNPESVFAILDAISQGLEVVAGLYPKKVIDFAQVAEASKRGVADDQLKYFSGPVVGNAEAGNRRSHQSKDGKHRFVQADRLGTGFLFMSRPALDKFIAFHKTRVEYRSLWEPKGLQHLVFFSEPMGARQKAKEKVLRMAERRGRGTASLEELSSACGEYNLAMNSPELDVYQTEDFSFTERAAEAGILSWMYLDAELAHQGNWIFESSLKKMLDHQEKK